MNLVHPLFIVNASKAKLNIFLHVLIMDCRTLVCIRLIFLSLCFQDEIYVTEGKNLLFI